MVLASLGAAILLSAAAYAAEQPRILVHGHRGARAERPENTIPAFEYAIAHGVDVLELDVSVTKDNVLVVSHDPALETPVCSGPENKVLIRTLTLAEIRQWDCGKLQNPEFPKQVPVPGTRMPTLDEVFALAPRGTFGFNVETKISPRRPELAPPPEVFAKLLFDQIHKHKLEKRVIVQSFDFRTLVEMRKLAPEVRLSALTANDPREFAAITAEAANAEIISPQFRLVTPEKVAAAHRAGIQVVPWTANAPADWDKLIEAKVDAIITDDPVALLAYLKSKGLH
ncbi:MAG: glycerophosphodiester phosphodiesterase [Bryobacterales bacterium]|nr:glycerophosphodiester phosphodiesterase [Bryobacterales bacterium]